MIPFNIEQFKTGNYDVVYRNGEVPLEWHWFEKAERINSYSQNYAPFDHKPDGRASENKSNYDLMLKPKEKWDEWELITDLFDWIVEKDPNGTKYKHGMKKPFTYLIRINQTNPNECSIEKIND